MKPEELIKFSQAEVEQTITSHFKKIVLHHPDRIAVDDGPVNFTYRKLDDFTARVAATILNTKNPGNTWICLLTEHNANMLVGLLSILKTGRGFVALDPFQPVMRLQEMIKNSESTILVCDHKNLDLAKALASSDVEIVLLDNSTATTKQQLSSVTQSPHSLACLLYTSGSTGRAKGVMLTHRNLLHVARKSINNFSFDHEDRIAMISSLNHVVGTTAVLLSLTTGACLLPFNLRQRGMKELQEFVIEERITYFHTVPIIFRRLANMMQSDNKPAKLRVLAIGGELVTREDVKLFKDKFSDQTRLRNSFGSTEAIDSFHYIINHETEINDYEIPIGYSTSELEHSFLIDSSGEEVKPGEVGEIVVSSDYLSPGYWNLPEDTAARFFEIAEYPDPLFKTGDRGFFDSTGRLVYLGRTDRQVKINGQRVELSEVENSISALDCIKEVCVSVHHDANNELYISAHVVLLDRSITPIQIKKSLRQTLPSYMVPSIFIELIELPQLPSGKVDRQNLPAPVETDIDLYYEQLWQIDEVERVKLQPSELGSLLVVADNQKLVPVFLDKLAENSVPATIISPLESATPLDPNHFKIDFSDHSQLKALVENLISRNGAYTNIVYLFTGSPPLDDDDDEFDIDRLHLNSCGIVLASLQPMLSHPQRPKRVLLITKGAQTAGEQNLSQPFFSTLWGLGSSISREHSETETRMVDLDPDTPIDLEEVFDEIIGFNNEEDQVCYRSKTRYVSRLKRASVDMRTDTFSATVLKNSTYLITGGLGDYGLAAGGWLAKEGAEHIVLVGRKGPSEKVMQSIEAIKSQGCQIHIMLGDISARERVNEIVNRIHTDLPPLKGVIHAAGVSNFNLLKSQKWNEFRNVLAPKVQGAWNLHQVTKNHQLDFFMMVSSITTVFGFVGHADYCAANAFLNSLAAYRRSIGLTGLSINYGLIEGGMAKSSSVIKWVEQEGLAPLTIEQALVGIKVFSQQTEGNPIMAKIRWPVAHAVQSKVTGRKSFSLLQPDETLISQDQFKPITEYTLQQLEDIIRSSWENILQVGPIENVDADFFDLGGDSLSLIEMNMDVSAHLDAGISGADFFDHRTIRSLAQFLKNDETNKERSNSAKVISAGNNDSPIFFINSMGWARTLSNHLGEEQTLYCMNMFALTSLFSDRLEKDNIYQIAKLMAEDIKELHATGSFRLIGFCQDGLLTMELANVLKNLDCKVVSVCLIDSLFYDENATILRLKKWISMLLWPSKYEWIDVIKRRLKVRKVFTNKQGNKSQSVGAAAGKVGLRRRGQLNTFTNADSQFHDAYLRDAFSRVPGSYGGKVELFLSNHWRLLDISRVIEVANGQLTTHLLKGPHDQLFFPPYDSENAQKVAAVISR